MMLYGYDIVLLKTLDIVAVKYMSVHLRFVPKQAQKN